MRTSGKLLLGSAGALAAAATVAGGRRVVDDRALARGERSLLAEAGAGRFSAEQVAEVPAPGRRYLLHAIAPATPLASVVRLDTDFTMRLSEGSAQPVDLRGEEVLAPPRGFVWRARARMGWVPMQVRDYYFAGQGGVEVYALGLLPVVRASNAEVTRSARGRLAIEAIWLPSALLPGQGVRWEGISEEQARVVLTVDGEEIPLTLTVDGEGRLREVTMMRYGDVGVSSWQPIPYGVEVEAEGSFGGYTIPTRLSGGWWYGSERHDPGADSLLRVGGATFRHGAHAKRSEGET